MFAYRQELEASPGKLRAFKRIGSMHRKFGVGPEGARCRDCVQFQARQFANTYYKCRLFGVTGGPGTDWSGRYPACGRFELRAVDGQDTKRHGAA